MTAPIYHPPTVAMLFRRHLREMRTYATELEAVFGKKSGIVKRIRSCADSNEQALDACQARAKERLCHSS